MLERVESLIKTVAPSWALRRQQSRRALKIIDDFDKVREQRRSHFYESARPRPGTEQYDYPLGSAGDPSSFDNIEVRDKARGIWRNSVHAQGLVEGLVCRMAPIGLVPQSAALLPDGKPDTVFRDRFRRLWDEWGDECLTVGGMDIQQVVQQIAREIIVAGEELTYYRQWTLDEKKKRNLRVGMTLDIIESERLDNLVNLFGTQTGTEAHPQASQRVFQGVEVDEYGRDLNYYLRRGNPWHWLSIGQWDSEPYPASEFTFARKRLQPSMIRGISWLQPSMDTLLQIGDLEWNELTSSTLNAAMAAFIKTLPESNFQQLPDWADEDDKKRGYRRFPMIPGTIGRLYQGESIESYDTKRPYSGVGAYIEHLLRSIATAYPMKPSALHGNFVGSTYSSEASAEIENLPKREAMAEWFIQAVYEPIVDRLVTRARLEGYFDGYEIKTNIDPWERKLHQATWPQIQVRSINPQNDIAASWMKITSGLSSIKKEAQAWGTDWRENLKDLSEFLQQCKEDGIPEAHVLKMFEIATKPIVVSAEQLPQ